ncbi:MAG: hypothetical protein HKN96_10490 [Flavobacteriaceae bacterium]|nr:hypothetical protein [Bacteroidia bacterium]NND11630.1 hypothetical protein [Flavobacteriaceae bacterium]NNL60890.1 hypothetical protein [Flavobacteriaceae bacterium]
MNKIVQLLILTILFAFASCSNENLVIEQENQNNLILKKITYERTSFPGFGRVMNFNGSGQYLNSQTLDESETARSYLYNSDGKIERLSYNPLVDPQGGGYKNYVYVDNRLSESDEQFGDLIGAAETSYYSYIDNKIEKLTSENANPNNAKLTIYTFADNNYQQLLRYDYFSDANNLTEPTASIILFYDDDMRIIREEWWGYSFATQTLNLTSYFEQTFDDKINMFKNSLPLELIVEFDLTPDDRNMTYSEVFNRLSSPNNLLRKKHFSVSSNGQENLNADYNFVYTYNTDNYPVAAERYNVGGTNPTQIYTFEYYD